MFQLRHIRFGKEKGKGGRKSLQKRWEKRGLSYYNRLSRLDKKKSYIKMQRVQTAIFAMLFVILLYVAFP